MERERCSTFDMSEHAFISYVIILAFRICNESEYRCDELMPGIVSCRRSLPMRFPTSEKMKTSSAIEREREMREVGWQWGGRGSDIDRRSLGVQLFTVQCADTHRWTVIPRHEIRVCLNCKSKSQRDRATEDGRKTKKTTENRYWNNSASSLAVKSML